MYYDGHGLSVASLPTTLTDKNIGLAYIKKKTVYIKSKISETVEDIDVIIVFL